MRARAWALTVLLAGCGGGSGGGPIAGDAPPSTATERCHTAQLDARIESVEATVTVVSLRDKAAVACVLEGYVRVDLLDGSGAALPVQPTRLTDVPARRVTLKPGGAASFELHSRPTLPGGAPCVVVTPARLRITPPDEIDALMVDTGAAATKIAGCDSQYGLTAMQASA